MIIPVIPNRGGEYMDQVSIWKKQFEKNEFFQRFIKDCSYLWKDTPKPQVKKYDPPFNYKLK